MFKYNMIFFRKNKILLLFFLFLSFLTWSISIFLPLLSGRLIDILTISKNLTDFKNIIFIICVLSSISLILNFCMNILDSFINLKLSYYYNSEVLSHVKHIAISKFSNVNPGYLTQKIVSDSKVISNFSLTSIRDVPYKILTLLVSFIILFNLNTELGLILTILIPIYITLYNKFKRKMYKYNLIYKESESNYFEELNSHIESIKFIKVNSLSSFFDELLFNKFQTMFKHMIKATKISSLFSNTGTLITTIANIIILCLGAIKIINGDLTIGEFTIFNTYFNSIIITIDYLLNYSKQYQSSKVSFNRINKLLCISPDRIGNKVIDKVEKIQFENVTFNYKDSKNIIKEFSYEFKVGNVYRIKGENGSGKSTFLDLLIGLYNDSYSGSILYNDININDIDTYELRKKNISFVEQDLTIINGTVLENICLDNDVSEERFNLIFKNLNLFSFISKDKLKGYSKISRKSYTLSGGEKQKINIARALLKDSQVVILDEANSALDSNSTLELSKLISNMKKNKIIIIISHFDTLDSIVDYNISLNSSNELAY